MKGTIVAGLLGIVLLNPTPGAHAQGARTYYARLSPVPLTVAMVAEIVGSGSVTATLSGTMLTIAGKFEGLRSPATTANIHRGRKTGVRGPVAFELKVSPGTAGTISATLELTKAQLQDLTDGLYYVQIQSEKAPDGNLWGWLSLQENRR